MSDVSEEQRAFRAVLRDLRVWESGLAGFDTGDVPDLPLVLFQRWFVEAAGAGQVEPHAMALATVDGEGRPDVRTLLLHDADERGWHFATHATSTKGRQLAARPWAALGFYWPAQGRQVRVRGAVSAAGEDESRADLAVRSTGALAAALTGRQSEVLGSAEELARASHAAWQRAQAERDAPVPTWRRYVLAADEVEFFQGDTERRHVRLRYRRTAPTPGLATARDSATTGGAGWSRELLWP
ncbi:pyridoxal 5'-phosphate synthase [Streptomyces sp. NPDC058665]|uniref:pyridoxine/pyridoxamine 5'-phosphate oxidase n=1 Tax=Streptomyces sp. NPDC058665 TaxID=3346586 RepID=UPI0036653307